MTSWGPSGWLPDSGGRRLPELPDDHVDPRYATATTAGRPPGRLAQAGRSLRAATGRVTNLAGRRPGTGLLQRTGGVLRSAGRAVPRSGYVGAALGSVVPIIGTTIGGLVGGVVGYAGGSPPRRRFELSLRACGAKAHCTAYRNIAGGKEPMTVTEPIAATAASQ